MPDLTLNNPHVRQDVLRQRLETGAQLVASDLATEFDISLDTIRRDLLVLEEQGIAQRVRGGAVPVGRAAKSYMQRRENPDHDATELVAAALPLIKDGMSVILDGGTTLTLLAEQLPPLPGLLIITPSPVIASILLQKDIATHLIGGRISPWGGVAVGHEAEVAFGKLACDLAYLGVCGLDVDFGLSADDPDEASSMSAMITAARETILVCNKEKIGKKARHHVTGIDQVTTLITDADPSLSAPYMEAEVEVIHV